MIEMSILSVLYTVIIAPIETVIEVIFCFEMTKMGIFGVAGAIVAVSLAVGFLTLPIYNVADAIQKRERETQTGMADGVKRIRDTFSGDERFMLLQTFYREHHWHPLFALRSSLSIMIEVPFFIAAYHFLSHCPALQGAQCGVLRDLGKPDALIVLGNIHINLLPILMTAINAVSSAVYLKGFTLREKAQTYCLALIFLVLLYNSPSGLVLYWTLNNLFSLAKNAVQRWVKRPAVFVHVLISAMLLLCSMYLMVFKPRESIYKRLLVLAIAVLAAILPPLMKCLSMRQAALPRTGTRDDKRCFPLLLASCVALALLCGLVLPSNIVASDPGEFCFVGDVASPLYYVWHTLCVYLGLFVLWPAAIYFMFGDRVKRIMPYLFAFLLIAALLNAYLFKYDYGTMDMFFALDNRDVLVQYTPFFVALPVVLSIAAAVVLLAISRKHHEAFLALLAASICFAEAVLSGVKISFISKSFRSYAAADKKNEEQDEGLSPIYHLSKDGHNVVVLFLDRAVNSFFPYIVKQFPELQDKFDGFVYYPNTLSFSNCTSKGAPAMMAGYEYTPEAENERPDESLKDKHNEASLVMPKLFLDAGYAVTVTDPPYANFCDNHDDTAFRQYPEIKCAFVEKKYAPFYSALGSGLKEQSNSAISKHAVMFCLLQVSYPALRHTMYNDSSYFLGRFSRHHTGHFAHLYFMATITDASSDKDAFIFIGNGLTHSPTVLMEPLYVPGYADEDKATCGYYKWSIPAKKGSLSDVTHYHVNAAAMLQTAKWLDKLRALGVYDNTRIIIVADHGKAIPTPAFGNTSLGRNKAEFNPLFMVKDFDAHGSVQTDDAFMTNADTVFLATAGLPVSGTNPFTGKAIDETCGKAEVRVYPAYGDEVNATGNQKVWMLKPPQGGGPAAYSVHDDIFKEENWTKIEPMTE